MRAMSHAAPSSASPPPSLSSDPAPDELDDLAEHDELDEGDELDDGDEVEAEAAPPSKSSPRRPGAPAGKRQPPKLTTKQICAMRGEGHHLQPVVLIGKEGITDGLCAAVEAALDSHGLIKIRVSENAPSGRREAAAELAAKVAAALVQVLGRTALLYRQPPPKPASAARPDGAKAGGRPAARTPQAGRQAGGRAGKPSAARSGSRTGSAPGGRERSGSRPPRRGPTSSS